MRPSDSVTNALTGDARRVGGDLRRALLREIGRPPDRPSFDELLARHEANKQRIARQHRRRMGVLMVVIALLVLGPVAVKLLHDWAAR